MIGVLQAFGTVPDVDLDTLMDDKSPGRAKGAVLGSLDGIFGERPLDLALVHGDTTTAAASLAAFHHGTQLAEGVT